MTPETLRRLLAFQRNEITEHHVYRRLAASQNEENRRVLERIAPHADFFRRVLDGHGGHLVQWRVVDLLATELRSNTPVSLALSRGPLTAEVASTAVAVLVAATMIHWFSQNPRQPVADQARLIRDLVLHTVIGGLGADAQPTTVRSSE